MYCSQKDQESLLESRVYYNSMLSLNIRGKKRKKESALQLKIVTKHAAGFAI